MSTATIAAIRFGYGLSPTQPAPRDADALLAGLTGPDPVAARYPIARLDTLRPLMAEFTAARKARKAGKAGAEDRFIAIRREINDVTQAGTEARLMRAVFSPDGFRERLEWFWADHFTVRAKFIQFRPGPNAFVEETIRPTLTGPFREMLRRAATHPVMLHYLDQAQSIGPNSPAGKRGSAGLNENLAREILELHTLGVGAGYTQADVVGFARLLTGLSFNPKKGFRFRPKWAEPGPETVLGQSYGSEGPATLDDIYAALDDIARHPATAAHLSRKLAVHFVSDDPDPDLVATMTAAWQESDGDLARVYAAMLAHPAAWAAPGAKVRQPWDFVAASLRALGTAENAIAGLNRRKFGRFILEPMDRMGQTYQRPPGPDGWPEEAAAWITAPALAERISWAMSVERLHSAPLPEPSAFVTTALGDMGSDTLASAVRAAESRPAGVGLVLASAEFNRR